MTPAAAAAAAAANPFAPRVQYVNFVTSDGLFHSLWLSNGEEPQPGIPFLPKGALAQGLFVANGHAYAATSQGCGGAANGVWALDVATKKVSTWKAAGNGVAGHAGPAFGPDGTVYAATLGGELVALEEKTLAEKSKFAAPSLSFNSSPVIFKYKTKDLLAVTSSEGKLHVFDTASLAQPLAQSAASLQPNFNVGALASWQDPAGTRWILTPSGRGIIAWKLSDEGGAYKLERAWASRSMINPLTPIIVNGVVFSASGGDQNSPAVLYAIDALTGKDVWNSGSTIKSHAVNGSLAAGGSRVFLSTADGVQYVFGIPLEI
jgi:outer membrane protein assembly factor BamB